MAGAFYEDVYDWWDYGSRVTGGDLADTPAGTEANDRACALADPNLAACPLAPTNI